MSKLPDDGDPWERFFYLCTSAFGDTSVVVLSFYVLVFKISVLLALYVCFHFFS